jgi:transformation/transcription domain-associated protein
MDYLEVLFIARPHWLQAVLNLQVPVEHSKEVNDCKNLIKTLVMGMKTIIWSITHAHLPRPQVCVKLSLVSVFYCFVMQVY